MSRRGVKAEEATEEERLLQQQQRAQAEQEAARRKEETLTLYLKDKLQKEQRNAAVNRLKLTDAWRRIRRQEMDGELKAAVAVLQQTSERRLDELSAAVQGALRELREAERQAEWAGLCHLQQVERLEEEQQKRLRELQRRWESGLLELSAGNAAEREQTLAELRQKDRGLAERIRHAGTSRYLQGVLQEMLDQNLYDQEELDFQASELEEPPGASALTRQLLQETRASLDELDRRTTAATQEIGGAMRSAKRLKEQAAGLQRRVASSRAENEQLQRDWSAARQQLLQRSLQLQQQLAAQRLEARRKLSALSLQCAGATRRLQAAIAQGQKVLQAAELCNKLHLQQQEGEEEQQQEEEEQQQQEEVQLHQGALHRCLHAALLHRATLRRHQEALRRENQQLQELLDRYGPNLQGHPAPLPVLRAPLGSGPLAAAAERRLPVIEAAHLARKCLV